MDQASVSTEPGLEIGPVNCGKLLNCNEFMKYVVQIVNKERRSLKKILLLLFFISLLLLLLLLLLLSLLLLMGIIGLPTSKDVCFHTGLVLLVFLSAHGFIQDLDFKD